LSDQDFKIGFIACFTQYQLSIILLFLDELNLMIQNMIINASLPFNLVEQIDFKNLITLI